MSGASGRTREEYTVYNVMLPRRYHPEWQGNLFERRCKVRSALSSYLPQLSPSGYHDVFLGFLMS